MAAFGNSAQVEHLEALLRQAFRSAGLAGVSGVAGEAKALAGLNEKEAFAQKEVPGQAGDFLPAGLTSAPVADGALRVYYYHCDPVGLPLALSDEAGTVCWAARHDPWGNIEEEFNADPEHIEQTLRLPGQQHDKATGLYYNRHRFYDPRLGAYISQDPIGLAGGMQPYRYPHNPFGAIDPWGLEVCYVHFPDYPITYTEGKTNTLLGGHAGVLGIGLTGKTRYYEYGRYSSGNLIGQKLPSSQGNIRRISMPDLIIKDGNPTQKSMDRLTAALSKRAGAGTKVTLTCNSNSNEQNVYEYIENIANNLERKPYSWNPFSPNHCRSFAKDAVSAGLP
ncbi:RHS repeat-associated core domain-containing protein [Dentiradicibacter hellwigii]|uniref:RHS repeat-associated core domain-containing protein n=1 Tax=Dentiradicibacter hellwigii TaxID=3149053 RepID=A0ABV4UFY7_9RHOO